MSANKIGGIAVKELLAIEIDGLPPTVNMMYRGLQGHRYKTKECLEWQSCVVSELAKSWDVDNRVKALQDCLSKAELY